MTHDSSSSIVTPITQDYIKTIFVLGEGEPVGTSELARALDVAPASATSMTKRLADAGLVDRSPYRGVALTDEGKRIAVELIRRHRLIELFLHEILGLRWDQVHAEAEKWEHVISPDVESRIDKLLGYPTHDPHGAPIPTVDLELDSVQRVPLSRLRTGKRAKVYEVSDDDPALLRYVGELGLYPGAPFVVVAGEPFAGGPITLQLEDAETEEVTVVDGRAAASIFVKDGDR